MDSNCLYLKKASGNCDYCGHLNDLLELECSGINYTNCNNQEILTFSLKDHVNYSYEPFSFGLIGGSITTGCCNSYNQCYICYWIQDLSLNESLAITNNTYLDYYYKGRYLFNVGTIGIARGVVKGTQLIFNSIAWSGNYDCFILSSTGSCFSNLSSCQYCCFSEYTKISVKFDTFRFPTDYCGSETYCCYTDKCSFEYVIPSKEYCTSDGYPVRYYLFAILRGSRYSIGNYNNNYSGSILGTGTGYFCASEFNCDCISNYNQPIMIYTNCYSSSCYNSIYNLTSVDDPFIACSYTYYNSTSAVVPSMYFKIYCCCYS